MSPPSLLKRHQALGTVSRSSGVARRAEVVGQDVSRKSMLPGQKKASREGWLGRDALVKRAV